MHKVTAFFVISVSWCVSAMDLGNIPIDQHTLNHYWAHYVRGTHVRFVDAPKEQPPKPLSKPTTQSKNKDKGRTDTH